MPNVTQGRLPEHALQPDMVSFNTLMAITAEQQPNLAIELLGEMYVGGPWSWLWGLCLIVSLGGVWGERSKTAENGSYQNVLKFDS